MATPAGDLMVIQQTRKLRIVTVFAGFPGTITREL